MDKYDREKKLYLMRHPEKRKPDYWAKPARPVDIKKFNEKLKVAQKMLKQAKKEKNPKDILHWDSRLHYLNVQLRLANEK